MKAEGPSVSAGLSHESLWLHYPKWVRWIMGASIVASVLLVVFPLVSLAIRIIENRPEKEFGAIAFLVFGFGSGAIYFSRYFRGFSLLVIVTADMIRHGDREIRWSDLASVWRSDFFSILRIKGSRGQVIALFDGLPGIDVVAAIAKEKKAANQALQTTPMTRTGI